MSGRLIGIHQPNCWPWAGYFDKIARSDIFVLLDNTQLIKTGGSWVNRVRLIISGQATWMTVPVIRPHGVQLIKDVMINESTPWRDKLLKTIQMNYTRAPFFKQVFPLVEELISNPTDKLAEHNETSIRAITNALGLDTSKLVLGSSLDVTGTGTNLLVSMTLAVNGTSYLCGGGATYQEDDKFAQAGIELIYQQFKHPVYPQVNTKEFIPGLSIIDALMNCGIEGTRKLLC